MNDQQRIETAADNCEVLRARLAKYEDADGRPVHIDVNKAARALCNRHADICGVDREDQWKTYSQDFIEDVATVLAALKAQPTGVVQWPDADEIMQMAFEEGQPGDDASGYYFELEEFDLFLQRLMEEVARLNSSPVSAGEPVYQFQCREIGEGDWEPCDHSRYMYCQKSPEHDTRVVQVGISAGGVDERASFEAWYLGHFYMGDKQCGLEWLSTEPCGGYRHQHPAEQWIVWQARAALSAPSHGEQVRDNRAEFKREERYMVVKLSKLADDLGGDELSREEQIYRLAHFGRALVECVVVESDWPEYEPTWAAIKARVTGSIASNQLPGGWAAKPTDDGEGFIISSPRVNGVASHFSVFPDSKDYASCALWKMLAAAPSAGSQEQE